MIGTVTYNPAVDMTMRFDEAISASAVNRARSVRYDASGKGINVSRFLSALGIETVATGPVGGFSGEYLSADLESSGVDHDLVPVAGRTRINTTAIGSSESFKLNQAGPTVGDRLVEAISERLRGVTPEWVHVGGSLPPGLDSSAIDALREGPWRLSVDVGGETLQRLRGTYDLCTPNRDELHEATGMDVSTVEHCLEAARALRRDGFEHVVATLGAEGAVAITPETEFVVDTLDAEAVDAVGAGDGFAAGLLAALEAGRPFVDGLRDGTVLAGEVVQSTGVPTLDRDWPPSERDVVHVERV